MRLGEILLGARLLTRTQLSAAVLRQKTTRGRLGSQLLDLGYVTPDQVALALAKQRGVPPALLRHFINHDPTVLKLISVEMASQELILPIAYSGAGARPLVVCLRDPHRVELCEALARHIQRPVLPCVAAERTILTYLAYYYGHGSAKAQGLDAPPPSSAEDVDVDFDEIDADEGAELPHFELVDLDADGVEKTSPEIFVPVKMRRNVFEQLSQGRQGFDASVTPLPLVDADTTVDEGTVPPTPLAVSDREPPPEAAPPEAEPTASFDDILSALDGAQERPEVDQHLLAFLRQSFDGAVIFTVKDGLAMGHLGFGGHLDDPETVLALMLPLNGTIFGAAHGTLSPFRGKPQDKRSAAQERFLKLFDLHDIPSDVVVSPILVGNKVACLIYAHGGAGNPLSDGRLRQLAQVSEACTRAFARIIQNKKARQRSQA